MNSQELRNLQEAYLQVYQELDEAEVLAMKGGVAGSVGQGGNYMKQDYEYDAFDYILEYLVTEGYAETSKQAQVIMVNMSEEWRESIMEMDDFAAGGGNAKMKKTGMTKDQVVGLGKKNLANLAKKQTPQQPQSSSQPSQVPATKERKERQFIPPKSRTISGVGKPAAARASEIGPVTAADKFNAYNDAKDRSDTIASFYRLDRKDPKLKDWASKKYDQDIALKTNDPKYDPRKASYPEFTPRKKTGRETFDQLGGRRS